MLLLFQRDSYLIDEYTNSEINSRSSLAKLWRICAEHNMCYIFLYNFVKTYFFSNLRLRLTCMYPCKM
jgi:hypothetical protein